MSRRADWRGRDGGSVPRTRFAAGTPGGGQGAAGTPFAEPPGLGPVCTRDESGSGPLAPNGVRGDQAWETG